MADLPTHSLHLKDLAARRATEFSLTPSASQRVAVAEALGILGLKKLLFTGQLTPVGPTDWELTAKLGATVVQACVVTLDPVTSRIDEPVSRVYTAHFEEPDENDIEMAVDENTEPLPATIDVAAVMIEALSLALPTYPRIEGAQLGAIAVTERGIAPMTDDDAKPFAGLADLKKSLEKKAE